MWPCGPTYYMIPKAQMCIFTIKEKHKLFTLLCTVDKKSKGAHKEKWQSVRGCPRPPCFSLMHMNSTSHKSIQNITHSLKAEMRGKKKRNSETVKQILLFY